MLLNSPALVAVTTCGIGESAVVKGAAGPGANTSALNRIREVAAVKVLPRSGANASNDTAAEAMVKTAPGSGVGTSVSARSINAPSSSPVSTSGEPLVPEKQPAVAAAAAATAAVVLPTTGGGRQAEKTPVAMAASSPMKIKTLPTRSRVVHAAPWASPSANVAVNTNGGPSRSAAEKHGSGKGEMLSYFLGVVRPGG